MGRKSLLILGLTGCATALLLSERSSAQAPKDPAAADEAARIRIGFAVAPVPLALRQKDPNLVGYGSYLVNTQAGCNDCHTNPSYLPSGDPFMAKPARVNVADTSRAVKRLDPSCREVSFRSKRKIPLA